MATELLKFPPPRDPLRWHGPHRTAGGRGDADRARPDGQATVLRWDKDDCAYISLVKFDMLGLGMLAALQ
jgi:hypothetical protein